MTPCTFGARSKSACCTWTQAQGVRNAGGGLHEPSKQDVRLLANASCPLLEGEPGHNQEEVAFADAMARDTMTGEESERDADGVLKQTISDMVDNNAPNVGMCNRFQLLVLLPRLLGEWSRRFALLS